MSRAKATVTKKGNKKDKESESICDVCAGPFKAFKGILHCEGSCCMHMHRYSTVLSRWHYMEFTTSFTSFVCLVCTQCVHTAKVQVLQAEIAAHKEELKDSELQL